MDNLTLTTLQKKKKKKKNLPSLYQSYNNFSTIMVVIKTILNTCIDLALSICFFPACRELSLSLSRKVMKDQ